MTQSITLRSALVLLLAMLVLSATQMTHANSLSSDIFIDGNFDEWSDEDGTENCQIDEDGATDVNILYEYEFSGGVPIERKGYYWDINKQCVSVDTDTNNLYLLQTAYREFSVPYDWDTYDHQTVCTYINTDPSSNGNYDYAICTDIYISYCHGSNPSCSVQSEKRVQLMSCDDSSNTLCENASGIRTYSESSYANGVGDNMTFQVWVAGQLRSFFDDMTEIRTPFSDIGIDESSAICVNTVALIYESDSQIRDTVLSTGNDYCISINGDVIIPTSIQLADQQAETGSLPSSTLVTAIILLVLSALSVTAIRIGHRTT